MRAEEMEIGILTLEDEELQEMSDSVQKNLTYSKTKETAAGVAELSARELSTLDTQEARNLFMFRAGLIMGVGLGLSMCRFTTLREFLKDVHGGQLSPEDLNDLDEIRDFAPAVRPDLIDAFCTAAAAGEPKE